MLSKKFVIALDIPISTILASEFKIPGYDKLLFNPGKVLKLPPKLVFIWNLVRKSYGNYTVLRCF